MDQIVQDVINMIIRISRNPYKLLFREVKTSNETIEKLYEIIKFEIQNKPLTIKLKKNPKIEELYTFMLNNEWTTKNQIQEIAQDTNLLSIMIRLKNHIKRKRNITMIKSKTIKKIKYYKIEPKV